MSIVDRTPTNDRVECPRCEQAKRWLLNFLKCPLCKDTGMVSREEARLWRQQAILKANGINKRQV